MKYMDPTTHRWMNTWLLAIFIFMSMLGTSIAIQNKHSIIDCESELYNKLMEVKDANTDK